ncbi:MAG: tetratricopeptide repeat protein, partial [Lachnospiraceae bacterium]|nr:tetratricopeptide repeat protein [Lachnospiraceae bacterium]
MGKKFGVLIIMVILFLSACSMNSTSRAWQEKYDLGIQYLAEGDYSTAIVEFSSAIEIEPKYASLYIARGDAYSEWAKEVISDALETVAGGEFIKWEDIVTEENIYSLQELYDNAIIDYEAAVNLLENGEATDQSDDTLD